MATVTAGSWWQRARARLLTDARAKSERSTIENAQAWQAAIPLFFAIIVAFRGNLFLDGDTGWHLGTGRWIVEQGAVPLTDPFSHTMPGQPWMAHEWLSEVLMFGAHAVAGWAGLAALFSALFGLTLLILAREAFRALPVRWAATAVIVSGGILLNFALARPHLLAWPLLAFWTVMLLRAREERRAPPLACAALLTIWANLHASYIVAFGLAGLFALESLIENPRDRRLLGRWVLFGALMLVAALLTPFGPQHFLFPFQVSNMEALNVIGEWRRSTITSETLLFVCVFSLLLFVIARWRTLPPLRVLLLAALSVMAILHVRHQMLFVIIGLPVFLTMIVGKEPSKAFVKQPGWLAPGLLAVVVLRLLTPYSFEDTSIYPLGLLSKVPAEMRREPVYNEYSQGGPLVMLGIRPYIDGRADMYGDERVLRSKAITNGDMVKFREDTDRYGIRWAVLENVNALTPKLAREPGWRVFGRDAHATVFVRTD